MSEKNIEELKKFGLIWAVIFFYLGIHPLFRNEDIRLPAIILSAGFVFISFFNPAILSKFYKLQIKVGDFIGNIVSKTILFILFYGLFTPVAIVLKILNKDLLNKKIDKNASTYFIKRELPVGSLKNQF